MKIKIIITFILITFLAISFINVQAAGNLLDTGMYENIYKLSEQQSDILRPFTRFFNSSAVYDKDINHSGVTFGSKTIDITKKLSGMQVIMATDTVKISGTVENAIIISSNVVIEGQVTGDILIIAPSIFVTEQAKVNANLIVVGDTLEVKGLVEGNLIGIISRETYISGVIKDDFRIISEKVVLKNEDISGDVYVETNSDINELKSKYPNGTIVNIVETPKAETRQRAIIKTITKGIIMVILYTTVCYLVTKKENNIATNITAKFTKYTVFSMLMGVLMLLLILVLPILLILMAASGLGIIAWPIMIIYFAILLLSISISKLVVGAIIYELIKKRVKKLHVLVMASVFAIIYVLTIIPYISGYVLTMINLLSIGVITTHIFRNTKKEEIKKDEKEE